jgi:hypothetical protein
MAQHKGPMPEPVRDFWRIQVKGSISGDGEDVIDMWEDELNDYVSGGETDYIQRIYRLDDDDVKEIRDIISEFRQTREQEEAERERRRLAEEKADEAMANHYAEKIKKIIVSKPNKFLPKPKKAPTARTKKSH